MTAMDALNQARQAWQRTAMQLSIELEGGLDEVQGKHVSSVGVGGTVGPLPLVEPVEGAGPLGVCARSGLNGTIEEPLGAMSAPLLERVGGLTDRGSVAGQDLPPVESDVSRPGHLGVVAAETASIRESAAFCPPHLPGAGGLFNPMEDE